MLPCVFWREVGRCLDLGSPRVPHRHVWESRRALDSHSCLPIIIEYDRSINRDWGVYAICLVHNSQLISGFGEDGIIECLVLVGTALQA